MSLNWYAGISNEVILLAPMCPAGRGGVAAKSKIDGLITAFGLGYRAENEREMVLVFHQNGLTTVSARLIAPGSRVVGFGPYWLL
jgi:hypothetical protein